MDNDMKWLCILGMVVVLCSYALGTAKRYMEHQEAIKALESGYVQQRDGMEVLWVKPRE